MNFEIQTLRKGIYSIIDEGDSSFYIVEGSDKAAVIDTGITPGEAILPTIRSLTKKPLLLVITHAHIDHMHHMDEFEEIYMNHKELLVSPSLLEYMQGGKALDLEHTVHVETGTTISLGDDSLEICELAGHTPGGIIVLEKNHHLLFTGDCIGSGCGVWMQVGTATSLTTFNKSLRSAFKWLVDHDVPIEFWGGHNKQVFLSKKVPGYNPLNLGLMADLIDLTYKVMSGEIEGTPTTDGASPTIIKAGETVRYAAYGRAEMLYIKEDMFNERYLSYY